MKSALEVRKRCKGEKCLEFIETVKGLAILLIEEKKFDKAIEYYEQSINLRKAIGLMNSFNFEKIE